LKLLCLSNGHGEDEIGAKILQALRQLKPPANLAALPIVGVGKAYSRADIPLEGPVQTLPSGGFVNMDGRELWRDLRGGLVGLTLGQWRVARHWAAQGGQILAVGDIVPLLMAHSSGAAYAFVGTAKSEYHLRDAQGEILPHRRGSLAAWTGAEYLPWERWLLHGNNCRALFPRDRLTAQILQGRGLPAADLGNPMMDEGSNGLQPPTDRLGITILPGSRPPEAYRNWRVLIAALENLAGAIDRPIEAVAAIAGAVDLTVLADGLTTWQPQGDSPWGQAWQRGQTTLHICTAGAIAPNKNRYGDCLDWGHLALAMAGTATEQFVGRGKPAIVIPGSGPQFTLAFAQRQQDLLGASILLAADPSRVGAIARDLLQDDERLAAIAHNGKLRMGLPGAAAKIAQHLLELGWA
jgi:uncharacterized protein (TIGR03492 family)